MALPAAQPSAQKERKSLRLECLLPFSPSCPDPVSSPPPWSNSSQDREGGLWECCVCFNRESMAGLEQDNRTEHARKLSPPGLVNSFLRNRNTSEAFKKLFVSFLLTVNEKLFSKCFYFTVSTFRSHGVDLVQNAAGANFWTQAHMCLCLETHTHAHRWLSKN